MYQSLYTGKQVDEGAEYAVNPSLFCLKSNLDAPMNQTIAVVNTYQDVIFANTDLLLNGNFSYDGDKVTYTGVENIDLELNMSCSVSSTQANTKVYLGQDKNGVVDPGAETSTLLLSTGETNSLNFATHFTMVTNDTLNLKIKADKTATISMEHFQVFLSQKKVTV